MSTIASARVVAGLTAFTTRYRRRATGDPLAWRALPLVAQCYVAIVIAAGAWVLAASFPGAPDRPWLFVSLLAFSCITSAWKVNLPLPLSSGSTLSVSYAADLMALLLLGTGPAMLIAITGGWMQCTFNVKRAYPWYRTVFSMAGEAITIYATGAVYLWLSGGAPLLEQTGFSRTVVGMIAAYFVVNTGLVAGAIAWSTRQNAWRVWHDTFLWSAPSFMVAGTAGATSALIVARDNHWTAVLMLAPVYLAYRTYQMFLGRIEDQRRHAEESERLHAEALDALLQARRAEQALAAETERLAVTLRSIGDGVITTDLGGAVVLVNQTAERLTGWTQAEAAGRPLDAVLQNLCPDTRQRCDNSIAMLTRRAGACGLSRCTVLVARDLSERPIEEIAAPLRDASGRVIGMVIAFRDITDALKAQAEQASANKLASLGLLAGGIAHDFNNILMAVMGSVSMARATLPASASRRALEEAEQACVRARQITWQLLTFSRGGVPVKKPVSIARLLDESATLALRGSNVRCTFDIASTLWPVAADDGQLVQVFSNIVINARQAMPHGGTVVIRAENVVESATRWEHALRVTPGRYVRISVADAGIGIADEHIGRIFDPYFTTKQQGSGLGLATAHSIVKNHGGYLSVTSMPGQGSTVFIGLPAMPAGDAPRERIEHQAGARGRILVMEDEPAVGDIAFNMLNFLGHDVHVVHDAQTAVEHYRDALASARPFDAVMLDLIVPGGIGGREALSLLSEVDPAVKAIVVSGYTRDAALAGAEAGPVRAFIAKPYTLDELDSTLSSVLTCGKWQLH
jgi:PAS domain S-box-containing protein